MCLWIEKSVRFDHLTQQRVGRLNELAGRTCADVDGGGSTSTGSESSWSSSTNVLLGLECIEADMARVKTRARAFGEDCGCAAGSCSCSSCVS